MVKILIFKHQSLILDTHPMGNPECKRYIIDNINGDLYGITNFVLAKFGFGNSEVINFLFPHIVQLLMLLHC